MHLRIYQPLDEDRSNCSVDGIASSFEYVCTRMRREIVFCSDRTTCTQKPRVKCTFVCRSAPKCPGAHAAILLMALLFPIMTIYS
jgi:hypothetical protein